MKTGKFFSSAFSSRVSGKCFAAGCSAIWLGAVASAAAVTVVDLKDVAAAETGAFDAAGCSWDRAKNVLRLEAGEYLVWDSAWNAGKPAASGSFYNSNPGLSIILGGDCSVTVSNVVAVSGKSENGVNSVIDLDGHDLELSLRGSNVFSVKVETQNIGPAIRVPAESSLVIDGDGSLYAHVYGGAPACIGSGYAEDSGKIVVRGGSVAAFHQDFDKCRKNGQPGLNGAAIGSGGAGNAGRIEIRGGSVAATNEAWAAAIGAGANYNGDGNDDVASGPAVAGAGAFDILVAGGAVSAAGGYDGGAALGGGHSFRRDSGKGACESACPIRIAGGTVIAKAGSLQSGKNFHETCGASAIGASMFNAGAAVVIDAAASVTILPASTNPRYNHNVVSGSNPVSPGSLSFSCADASSADGHVFLSTAGDSKLADVMPAGAAARESLPWFAFLKPAVASALSSAANSSSGIDYSLSFDPGSAVAGAASSPAALEGLPITAFSIDGATARFTYTRPSDVPAEHPAAIAAFSAWFAAFGGDVVAFARTSLSETESDVLPPDEATPVDNGDGTASFSVTLPTPLAPARFFQLAW